MTYARGLLSLSAFNVVANAKVKVLENKLSELKDKKELENINNQLETSEEVKDLLLKFMEKTFQELEK